MGLLKKIKKGSKVVIISGSNSGSSAIVASVNRVNNVVLLENICYKFSLSTDSEGKKIPTKTMIPIHISNVSLLSVK